MTNHFITLMVLLPLAGALLQAFLPRIQNPEREDHPARWTALASSLAASICAFFLVFTMQRHTAELQAVETLPWIGSYAITYEMGIDGLNVAMVLLIAILFPVLIASEWKQKAGARGVYGLLLILQTAFFGAVCAQDLFLLFFFWALSSLPFYFLIGIWGGERRERAAFRSIVTASIGNALLFSAMILIYYAVEPHTFSLRELMAAKLGGRTFEFLGHELSLSGVAFGLVCLGLAFRAAIWPLHGWFNDAATEAPSSVFAAVSAAQLPVAIYILMRLSYTLFPETLVQASGLLVAVGGLNLFVGAISAIASRDLRSLTAALGLTQTGLILTGIGSLSAAGAVGAVYEQLVLGLGLAGFGLFAGVVHERAGHSTFDGPLPGAEGEEGARAFGGIAARAPTGALISAAVIASLLGFPGFGGFVGHALLLIGSYPAHPWIVLLTTAALILGTYYLFRMYRLIFLGDPGRQQPLFTDLTLRERAYLLPVVSALVFFGVYPKPMLELVRPTILTLLSAIK